MNLQGGAVLSGSGTIGGSVVATGGVIALSPGGNIAGSVTVAAGTLYVGGAGAGNDFSTSGGLFVSGLGALARPRPRGHDRGQRDLLQQHVEHLRATHVRKRLNIDL